MLVQLWSLVLGHTPPYEVGSMDKKNAGWLVVGNMRLLTRWLGSSNYLPTPVATSAVVTILRYVPAPPEMFGVTGFSCSYVVTHGVQR